MEKLLTIEELSEQIGFATGTINHWIQRQAIPHLKISGRIRFKPKKIEAWLASQEIQERT